MDDQNCVVLPAPDGFTVVRSKSRALQLRKRRSTRTLRSMAIASAGLLLSACRLITDPGRLDSAARDLSRNMLKWQSQGYSSYDYVVSNQCFCVMGGVPVRVSVRGNLVVGIHYVSDDQSLPPDLAVLYRDVDGLFRVIHDAISARAASVNATYDPTLGYPADVFIDNIKNAADDEFGFHVVSFTPLLVR